MPWTREPPTRAGRYYVRFLPADGIDGTPFEVELVEDTINGGVCVVRPYGMCATIHPAYSQCEWWVDCAKP